MVHPLAKKLGYTRHEDVDRKNHFAKDFLLHTFFTNITDMGFYPQHIVDVGSNHGTWSRLTMEYFPDAHYTLIEPQHWLQPSFQDILDRSSKVNYYPVGAGSENGSFRFTVSTRDDSSSFRYSEQEAAEMGFRQLEIPIITLNDLINSNGLLTPDIIKIDAEGLDIEVLKGSSSFFGKTEIFMVEAAVFNKEFENDFLAMVNFMDQNGYRLFEITDLNRPFKPAVLWLVEIVFIKKNGFIDSKKII